MAEINSNSTQGERIFVPDGSEKPIVLTTINNLMVGDVLEGGQTVISISDRGVPIVESDKVNRDTGAVEKVQSQLDKQPGDYQVTVLPRKK